MVWKKEAQGQNVQLRYRTGQCEVTAGNGNEKAKKHIGDRMKEDPILFESRLKICLWGCLSSQMVILIERYHQ